MDLSSSDQELVDAALAVLDANWLGRATRPGDLYPHQWSWDSAAIAMGRASWDQARAETELRSLFAGQWDTGMLPHIVFSEATTYFPGPSFWQAERSPHAPVGVQTSGIVQPPIHATAIWHLYQRSRDRASALAFLDEMFPRLVHWHSYLYTQRIVDGGGLVEIWHPWESGTDNSPAWDDALQRISLDPAQVPSYERIDDKLADPAQRPRRFDYDRYAYLVGLARDADYDDVTIRQTTPFMMQPVLFNALLISSDHDLARIAVELDEDPRPYVEWAELSRAGFARLWDDELGAYLDFDVRAQQPVPSWTGSTYAPMFAGVPDDRQAARLMERMATTRANLGDEGWGVPSVALDHPAFDPALYWRGPLWPVLQWLAYQGAARYGYATEAESLRMSLLSLARRSGIWEHYNPITGRGQGDGNFAWTAGLLLDLLATP